MTLSATSVSPLQAPSAPGSIMPGAQVSNAFTGAGSSDPYSQMSQTEWLDYVNTFMPVENQAIAYATNNQLPTQSMLGAIQGVQQQESISQAARGREMAQYGIKMNPQEAEAANRETNISNSLAEVAAANRSGQATLDRQRAILGSPVPTGAPMPNSSSMTAVG